MRHRYVKIFGERNTGTTWLDSLIANNFEDVQLMPAMAPYWFRLLTFRTECGRDAYFRVTGSRNLGWKHRCLPCIEAAAMDRWFETRSRALNVSYVVLVKNPYSWLLSLFRRPYHLHKAETFEAFVIKQSRPCWRDRLRPVQLTPPEMWNIKHSSYVRFVEDDPAQRLLIRYEDLLADPAGQLNRIAELIGPEYRRISEWRILTASAKGDRDWAFERYRDYYLSEKWRSDLTVPVLKRINTTLDSELVTRLGYQILQPDNL